MCEAKKEKKNEMTSIPCGRAPCSISHTQTQAYICSLFFTEPMEAQQNGNARRQAANAHNTKLQALTKNKKNPRQAGKQTRKVSQEVEESTLLCLQVCEALKNEIKETGTERMFEKQQHTNTALVLSLCMLCMTANHDYHT